MSRKRRIWYPGAQYHVMARGVRKNAIFTTDEDYRIFLMIIKNIQEKYGFVVHSYCLMTNHFHLQISTKEIEIWRIMQAIMNLYAKQFNMMYGYKGHLFEDRYTSRMITDPFYTLEVSRYIHLNPVRAGIVQIPQDYEYSSYNTYIGREKPFIEDDAMILGYFQDHSDPRKAYRKYVEEKVNFIKI